VLLAKVADIGKDFHVCRTLNESDYLRQAGQLIKVVVVSCFSGGAVLGESVAESPS
jgi:hypothetical protein